MRAGKVSFHEASVVTVLYCSEVGQLVSESVSQLVSERVVLGCKINGGG